VAVKEEDSSNEQFDKASAKMKGDLSYEDDVNLLDYWRVIWTWRWMILGLCVATMLTSLVLAKMSPKIYLAVATMMPPSQSTMGGLSSLADDRSQLVQSLVGTPAQAETMVLALLKSRSMSEKIVAHFDLSLFHAETIQGAAGRLQGMTKIEQNEGIITISVEARDPQLAADLANAYGIRLDEMNQSMSLTAAKRNRVFVEERLALTTQELRETEEQLKDFQLRNMTVFLDEQVAGSMNEAGQMQDQLTRKELELKVKSAYLRLGHPELVKLRLELNELQEKLHIVETGAAGQAGQRTDSVYPAWVKVPTLALQFTQHKREVRTKEEVYVMLTTQLEQAKISEVKDDPTVQMLDPALPPDGPSKPRIKLIVLLGGFIGLCFGVFIAFVLDYIRRMTPLPEKTTTKTTTA